MADGDLAASIGLAIMNGLEKVKDLWKQENKTRDMVADHVLNGTHPASAINSGTLDAARIPGLDASKITASTFDVARIPSLPASKVTSGTLDAARIPNLDGAKLTAGNIDLPGFIRAASTLAGGSLNINGSVVLQSVPSTGLSGWVSLVARSADGAIGVAVSSRRFKKNIKPAPRRRTLLAAQIMTFVYKVAVDPEGTTTRGLIAEQLHDLGLTEYVVYDDQALPFSIRYELLVIDLLDIVQEHDERIERLEQQQGGV